MEYNIGDIVRTKKVHPCGSKFQGCGHEIMVERPKALKMITKIEQKNSEG